MTMIKHAFYHNYTDILLYCAHQTESNLHNFIFYFYCTAWAPFIFSVKLL